MKLNVLALKEGENSFHYQSSKDAWLRTVIEQLESGGERFDGDFIFDLRVTALDSDYVLSGKLEFKVVLACSRCAESFSHPIQAPFGTVFSQVASGAKTRPGLTNGDEELDVSRFDGQEIDFRPVVEEQVVLSIPYKVLCHQSCKGICQQCGQNRNVAKCACSEEKRPNAFSVLEQLKN